MPAGKRSSGTARAVNTDYPQRRQGGKVVVFRVPGMGGPRFAALTAKITGMESAVDPLKTMIYYPAPGKRYLVVEHDLEACADAVWPEEGDDE